MANVPLAKAEAVELVGVGTKATMETTAEQRLAEVDPYAAMALLGYVPSGNVTRAYAMRVPGIRRGRNLIAGTIGTLPLVATRKRAGQVETVDRLLLQQLDPSTTPAWTIMQTVDDLIFRPCSWWRVTDREVVGGARIGYPTAIERVAWERVQVPAETDSDPRVSIDGQRVEDADVIRIDGPDEGLLVNGAPIVRVARALLDAGYMTATDEVPSIILKPREGAPELPPDKVAKVQSDWEAARRERRTAYLNASIEAEHVAYDAQKRQLSELASWCASELARELNLPPSRIGAPQGSSMTYTTTESDRRDLLDTTLGTFLTLIAQRLSMPDVTPAGTTVGFDLTAYLRGTTTELVTAGAAAVAAGFVSRAEVRTLWLGLPADPGVTDVAPEPTGEDTTA